MKHFSLNRSLRNLAGCLLLLFSSAACEKSDEADTSTTNTSASANSEKLILVSGATGRQGGAVARELLSRGYRVRGLTRNPVSERARQLAGLGIEMVKGDFDDMDSLNRAAQGVYGVFSVQNFWEHGKQGEIRQGSNLADAAKQAGVSHFVYTSVANADKNTGIPHFDSKYEIEKYIQSIELPYTIIRPVSFMENWEYSRADIENGIIYGPLSPDTRHQHITVKDIGRFVAEAFDNPAEWLGLSLDIAGDEHTQLEIAEIFSRVTGKEVKYVRVAWDEFEEQQGEEMTIMEKWFENTGYSVNMDDLRDKYPWLTSLEQYLMENGW
jgi:uncharacterized protein YbjT (DUF2867 family)